MFYIVKYKVLKIAQIFLMHVYVMAEARKLNNIFSLLLCFLSEIYHLYYSEEL